jgi:putative transposase
MFLTYRYRLLPTQRQHRALEAILESQRQLYNAALEERIDAYRKRGIRRSYIDQTKALTEWRHSDTDAASLPVTLQRATLKRLDNAYRSFFRRIKKAEKPGFPRFRGKGWFNSFGFREFNPRVGISISAGRISFKGMPGTLRVHLHRKLPAEAVVMGCTFRRELKGWTVSFSLKLPTPPVVEGSRVAAIDLGITTFATLSDGSAVPSLRAARKAERRLQVADRAVSRKHRGSKGRRNALLDRRRQHAAVARRRRDYLHKISALLVRNHDVIAVEALNLRGLAQGALAKHIYDASWHTFISMLRYKAARAGARLVEVNSRNTTQDCSRCGVKVPKTLGERLHHCPQCGLRIDRDLNAARNILNRGGMGPGLHNVAGYGMRAGGNLSECRAQYRVRRPANHYPTLRLYSPR